MITTTEFPEVAVSALSREDLRINPEWGPAYVLGFMFSQCGTYVALIRKTKPDWQAGKLNGIGGKVESDETPRAAMCREFAEETGLLTGELDWNFFGDMSGEFFHVYCFVARGDVWKTRTVTDERVSVIYVQDVPDDAGLSCQVLPNLKWLVPLALNALTGDIEVSVKYK